MSGGHKPSLSRTHRKRPVSELCPHGSAQVDATGRSATPFAEARSAVGGGHGRCDCRNIDSDLSPRQVRRRAASASRDDELFFFPSGLRAEWNALARILAAMDGFHPITSHADFSDFPKPTTQRNSAVLERPRRRDMDQLKRHAAANARSTSARHGARGSHRPTPAFCRPARRRGCSGMKGGGAHLGATAPAELANSLTPLDDRPARYHRKRR